MPFSSLNLEQQQAIKAELGHNLVIASAGTGKTSTIVARIAYLIKQGINPKDILLLTFTNKAGVEMVERLAKLFGEDIAKKIEAGTFHSFSYRWLRKVGESIILKQPKELKTLFRSIYERRSFNHIDSEKVQVYTSTYLYDLYSLYLNSSNLPFDEWLLNKSPEQDYFIDIYVDIISEFNALKKEYGYCNFDDLLLIAREKAKEKNLRFSEVLVDEYQDTNPLQNSLIEAISKQSLFCVGDYDQSIYAFNGSDINIIASFKDRYTNAKVFTLNKNYRSTRSILSLANRVISINERIYPKQLEVVKQHKDIPPKLLISQTLINQYQDVAQKIKNSPYKAENIALIFRNNSSADGVEAYLREYSIQAKRRGGVGFFETKEIDSFLNILTILENPHDMMSFIHIFEYAKGIGSAIAKDLFEALVAISGNVIDGLLHPKNTNAREIFKTRVKNYQLGLFEDFIELGSVSKFRELGFDDNFISNPILKYPKLGVEGAKFLYDFYELVLKFRRFKNFKSIFELVERSELFAKIKMVLATQRATQKDGNINKILFDDAIEKIEKRIAILKNLASHYDELNRFLNAMILGSKEMSEGSGINLLTVHASKGLEFDEVYIVDLMDGRFPNNKLISKGGSIDEERRLFYVAVTRAKESLYLSFAYYDENRKKKYEPSQFLIEAGLIRK